MFVIGTGPGHDGRNSSSFVALIFVRDGRINEVGEY